MRSAILLVGLFIADSINDNFLPRVSVFGAVLFCLFLIMDIVEWVGNIIKK